LSLPRVRAWNCRRSHIYSLPSLLRKRLDVIDYAQDLLVLKSTLEGRHHRVEALDHLGRRVRNRLADVVLVRRHALSVAERYRFAENALPRRPRARRASHRMALLAAEG